MSTTVSSAAEDQLMRVIKKKCATDLITQQIGVILPRLMSKNLKGVRRDEKFKQLQGCHFTEIHI